MGSYILGAFLKGVPNLYWGFFHIGNHWVSPVAKKQAKPIEQERKSRFHVYSGGLPEDVQEKIDDLVERDFERAKREATEQDFSVDKLNASLHDADGKEIGGVVARKFGSVLEIDLLIVNEDLRRNKEHHFGTGFM